MGNTKRLIAYISSCNHNGTPVLPPDVNASNVEFTPVENGIRFGLMGVRGIGRGVAEEIIAERERGGRFTSLHDFVNRMDSSAVKRNFLEALVKGGAFDSTGYTRRQMMRFIDETSMIEDAVKRKKDASAGQVTMFDMFADDEDSGFAMIVPEPDGIEWEKSEKLRFEKQIMGIYVSEHPLAPYEDTIAKLTRYKLGEVAEFTKDIKNATFVGMVSGLSSRPTRRGAMMAQFQLEDVTGLVECITFDYDKFRDVLHEDAVVKVRGKFEANDGRTQIIAYEIDELILDESDGSIGRPPMHLEIKLGSAEFSQSNSLGLNRILQSFPGRDGVVLLIEQSDGRKFRVELPVTVDATSNVMRNEINMLFQRAVA